MSYKAQISKGIKVESEHKKTYNLVKKGKIKTAKDFYKSISADHVSEDANYYTKLKKANL
jgi:hypothetical protein